MFKQSLFAILIAFIISLTAAAPVIDPHENEVDFEGFKQVNVKTKYAMYAAHPDRHKRAIVSHHALKHHGIEKTYGKSAQLDPLNKPSWIYLKLWRATSTQRPRFDSLERGYKRSYTYDRAYEDTMSDFNMAAGGMAETSFESEKNIPKHNHKDTLILPTASSPAKETVEDESVAVATASNTSGPLQTPNLRKERRKRAVGDSREGKSWLDYYSTYFMNTPMLKSPKI